MNPKKLGLQGQGCLIMFLHYPLKEFCAVAFPYPGPALPYPTPCMPNKRKIENPVRLRLCTRYLTPPPDVAGWLVD